MAIEEQLIDLESRFAFQEQTIAELNQVVVEQQNQIDLLTRQLAHLIAQLRAGEVSPIARPEEERPPPHY